MIYLDFGGKQDEKRANVIEVTASKRISIFRYRKVTNYDKRAI